MSRSVTPPLPPGGPVDLPGRGRTFVRELVGPPGAPTVLLLHGWTVTADLNWFATYEPLARHYRVLAMDHRGHGRGIRTSRRFRLADCADDAAALCELRGIDRVIPVGYSMGGPIAQLMAHRHPERIRGLVLCATAGRFAETPTERAAFAGLAGLSRAVRLTPRQVILRLSERIMPARAQEGPLAEWARTELMRGDPRMILEAGAALGRYSSLPWLGNLYIPTAIVRTGRDQTVPPSRQDELARALRDATVHPIDADHTACVTTPAKFLPALLAACASVSREPLRTH